MLMGLRGFTRHLALDSYRHFAPSNNIIHRIIENLRNTLVKIMSIGRKLQLTLELEDIFCSQLFDENKQLNEIEKRPTDRLIDKSMKQNFALIR